MIQSHADLSKVGEQACLQSAALTNLYGEKPRSCAFANVGSESSDVPLVLDKMYLVQNMLLKKERMFNV